MMKHKFVGAKQATLHYKFEKKLYMTVVGNKKFA